MENPDFSVVIPVYSGAETITELASRLKIFFNGINRSFELVFVDDASADNSWAVLENLKSEYGDALIAISLYTNSGQHNATFCGIGFTRGKFIITLDDDLQHPPEEIGKLVECFENQRSDLVYGYFSKKKHSAFRNMGSRLLKKSGKMMDEGQGEGSSFRMITRSLADKILNHPQTFMYIDELFLWYTNDIGYALVRHESRKSGKSGYSTMRLIQLTRNIIVYYSAVPLKIMVYGGFVSSFLTFLVGIYYLLKKIFLKVPAGYTSIIVAILFSTSIIIFSLGIIGEYINRIYMMQNKKPPYSIRKILQ